MPLFLCSQCGCYENTALSNYWDMEAPKGVMDPPLCSACDPTIGEWHNEWPKASATGMLIDARGFLFHDAKEAKALNAVEPMRIVLRDVIDHLLREPGRLPRSAEEEG